MQKVSIKYLAPDKREREKNLSVMESNNIINLVSIIQINDE